MSSGKTIYVYFDRQVPELLGTLTAQLSRGKEIFAFEFDKVWLKTHPAQSLDPDLQFYSGPQLLSYLYAQKLDFLWQIMAKFEFYR